MEENKKVDEVVLEADNGINIIDQIDADITFSFETKGEVGKLIWDGKEFKFEGNVAESAMLFLEAVNENWPNKFVLKEKECKCNKEENKDEEKL